MNRQFANEWLDKLREYWFNKDVNKVLSLFKNTSLYQESPFILPFTTFSEIEQEWLFERDVEVFDGIYEIKFNDNLDCIYFKSWEMKGTKI